MKKCALIVLCLAAVGSSILFNATASTGSSLTLKGSEFEYYSDATYSDMVGARGYGDCRYRWGVTSEFVLVFPCQ